MTYQMYRNNYNLFADDTSVFLEVNNLNSLSTIINKELNKLSNWLVKKSLSFHNMLFIKKDDTLVTERKRSNNKHMYKLEANRVK